MKIYIVLVLNQPFSLNQQQHTQLHRWICLLYMPFCQTKKHKQSITVSAAVIAELDNLVNLL